LVIYCLWAAANAYAQDRVLLSAQLVGQEFTHVVQPGESLTAVGARFGVGVTVLARANGLPSDARLKIAQKLRIDNRHIVPQVSDGIVINIPQRMLFQIKQGQALRAYAVGLGKQDWPTPTGRFKVTTKRENPVWGVPKSIQEEMEREGKTVENCVPPGPDNPLGKHWLGLTANGYGIHGTIAPSSIYQFQTHGCIRLHPDDIAELYNQVERGTPVLLIYRRWLVAHVGARIFLEVHGDIYSKQPEVEQELRRFAESEDLAARIDWQLASDIMRKREGIARDITRED
jgi:L,D-transpeptidase ErfK/SrfK